MWFCNPIGCEVVQPDWLRLRDGCAILLVVRLCYLIGRGCLCVTGCEAATSSSEGPGEVLGVDQVHHGGKTTAVLRVYALQVQGTNRLTLCTMQDTPR